MTTEPFFSIGITTYNRLELLQHSIRSILEQQFADYEILIGNDYVSEVLTCEMLGVNDPRIIIINNDKNLGELGNMNNLLSRAKGSYFTWQFDDDLCSPEYLSEAYLTLKKFDFPSCLYTSLAYIYGREDFKFSLNQIHHSELYSGPSFLRAFLSGKLKLMATAGLYKTDLLRAGGGAVRLSSGNMAVYSEYLMLFKACFHSKIAYIDSELVGFRVHENSWSGTTAEAMVYKEAGINLLRASIPIIGSEAFLDDYKNNLTSLLKSIISMVITKNRLAGKKSSVHELDEYYQRIINEFKSLNPELQKISGECLSIAGKHVPFFKAKAFFRKNASLGYLRIAHFFSSIISPYINKSF